MKRRVASLFMAGLMALGVVGGGMAVAPERAEAVTCRTPLTGGYHLLVTSTRSTCIYRNARGNIMYLPKDAVNYRYNRYY